VHKYWLILWEIDRNAKGVNSSYMISHELFTHYCPTEGSRWFLELQVTSFKNTRYIDN
jgi:hypothetical protein